MKNKKLLTIILAFLLIFATVSCGGSAKPCEECIDNGGDGICDSCGKEIPKPPVSSVSLFEDGEPTFKVVLAKDASSKLRVTANNSIKKM